MNGIIEVFFFFFLKNLVCFVPLTAPGWGRNSHYKEEGFHHDLSNYTLISFVRSHFL